VHGKRLYNVLLDFMMGVGISVATVINEVDALRRRGKSTLRIEGISVNYPLVIEVVDEQSKLDPLLPQIKRMVGDNGLVTI
jgi:PII-like signaling protein